jgi:hypothetical protein
MLPATGRPVAVPPAYSDTPAYPRPQRASIRPCNSSRQRRAGTARSRSLPHGCVGVFDTAIVGGAPSGPPGSAACQPQSCQGDPDASSPTTQIPARRVTPIAVCARALLARYPRSCKRGYSLVNGSQWRRRNRPPGPRHLRMRLPGRRVPWATRQLSLPQLPSHPVLRLLLPSEPRLLAM